MDVMGPCLATDIGGLTAVFVLVVFFGSILSKYLDEKEPDPYQIPRNRKRG